LGNGKQLQKIIVKATGEEVLQTDCNCFAETAATSSGLTTSPPFI